MRRFIAALAIAVAMFGFATLPAQAGLVNVGDTFVGSSFDGSYRTWSFNGGCTAANPVREVAYVGDIWNDQFHSSRILANSCSSVKFFEHANFGGQWFSCDDLCNGQQGDWGIGVSSIKYRRNGG